MGAMIRWWAPDVLPIQTPVHQSRATHLHTRQSRMACSLVGRVPAAPADSCSFQKPPDGWKDNKGTVITALSDFFFLTLKISLKDSGVVLQKSKKFGNHIIEAQTSRLYGIGDNQFNCRKKKYCQTIAMSGCRWAGRTLSWKRLSLFGSTFQASRGHFTLPLSAKSKVFWWRMASGETRKRSLPAVNASARRQDP
jgi:hypothetical protein